MTDYPPAPAPPPASDIGDASLKDKASDAAQAAKQAGPDVAQTAADKAKDVAQEAGTQARDLLGEARDQVKQQAGVQHRSVVDKLRLLGDELDGMSTGPQQPGVATEVVSQARTRVHDVADWLDGREPGDLLEEIRSFARRRPGVFLLSAAMAGVLAGRLTRGVVAVHADEASAASDQAAHPTDRFAARPDPSSTTAPASAFPGDGESDLFASAAGTAGDGALDAGTAERR